MLILGLLGGIGSGKSAVAQVLAELGALVLNADAFAHDVLNEDDVRAALVERWGDGVLAPSGEVDRTQIARHVFAAGEAGSEARRFVERLVHPKVRERMLDASRAFERAGGQVVVFDVPLLLEAGWDRDCDLLLLVDAPREDRHARVAARGWDADELAQREAAQLPIKEKRDRAHVVVPNAGDLAELRETVRRVWDRHVAPRLS